MVLKAKYAQDTQEKRIEEWHLWKWCHI